MERYIREYRLVTENGMVSVSCSPTWSMESGVEESKVLIWKWMGEGEEVGCMTLEGKAIPARTISRTLASVTSVYMNENERNRRDDRGKMYCHLVYWSRSHRSVSTTSISIHSSVPIDVPIHHCNSHTFHCIVKFTESTATRQICILAI